MQTWSFRAGELIPEWLIYMESDGRAPPPRAEFLVDVMIVRTEGAL